MARGGKRPGAGRKKGQITKATVYRQEMLAKAAASGISPLEVMITAMRNAWDAGQINEAVQHAVHAAPYIHPRLASTDMKLDDKRSAKEFSTDELEAILAGSGNGTASEEEGESESGSVH